MVGMRLVAIADGVHMYIASCIGHKTISTVLRTLRDNNHTKPKSFKCHTFIRYTRTHTTLHVGMRVTHTPECNIMHTSTYMGVRSYMLRCALDCTWECVTVHSDTFYGA